MVNVAFTRAQAVTVAGGVSEDLGVRGFFDHGKFHGMGAASLGYDGDFGRVFFVGHSGKIDIPKVARGELAAG